jgi:hypothetical protein
MHTAISTLSRGHACNMCILPVDGTSTTSWRRHFFNGVQPSFSIGWFSRCCLPAYSSSPSLGPFVSSTMVLSQKHLPQRASATGDLFLTLESVPARLSTTSRGPFIRTAMTLPHQAADTSLLPFLHGGERRRTPGHRSGTFSLPSHSTRQFRSKAASRACRTLSPKMKSSVILVTNTQVFSGRHPRLNVTKASFNMGMVSLRCRLQGIHRGWLSLSGSPAAMSGLATVTAAPVSIVMRHFNIENIIWGYKHMKP